MEAIEYGLSNLIVVERRTWKAIYPTNTCLFTYGRDLSSCVIRPDRFRELSLHLSKKNRTVPRVSLIVAALVD